MEKIESELWSRGFRQNRTNNWMKGSKIVQIAHYSEFQNGTIRLSWKKDWDEKGYFALIFDYSLGGGPICIVPAKVFFNSQFVTKKQKMISFANSGFCWSQKFKFRDELPQLILGYKDRWDILDAKTGEQLIQPKSLTSEPQAPPTSQKVPEKDTSSIDIEKQINEKLQKKFNELPPREQKIISDVWNNKNDYIKWPKQSILLIPGLIRPKGGFHTYSPEEKLKFKEKGITIDSRTNGPAIMSYLYACGERPPRRDSNHEWTIHHIYDGKFPFEIGKPSLRAVNHGDHFTQSAGLVAIHPIADALADEYFYFAWLLRLESFKRFGYDPDNVFQKNR